MGIVTTVNHTLSHEVSKLRILMKSLLMEVKKHVVSSFLVFLVFFHETGTCSADIFPSCISENTV